TIAYSPQSNGIVERANREILRILRYAVIDGDKHWVEMLPVARFVLNTSFHSSTGTTPFMLVMGREGDPRRDLFLSKAEEGFFKNYSECEEKTKDFLGKLREEALKEQIATRKRKHSRDEESERPVEGTFVWLLPVGKKKGKLQKRRRGPFQVEKVMPNFLVKLRSLLGAATLTVHQRRVAKVVGAHTMKQMQEIAAGGENEF
ncbi:hypothetical protein ADUPG1_001222, partial [Aduncisulcus paluster]